MQAIISLKDLENYECDFESIRRSAQFSFQSYMFILE